MTFDEAQAHVLPVSPYFGNSLEEVGRTDEGLLFLEKISSWSALWDETRDAIKVYLAHESVASRLADAIREDPFRER